MKEFNKNRILATFLLSACSVGLENVDSEAFSEKFVCNETLGYNELTDDQEAEIRNLENSEDFQNYIKLNKNITGYKKKIILLTLAGIRKENNNVWKTILRALKKTHKILKIKFSYDFDDPCEIAYSTTTSLENPIIVFKKKYFNSENLYEFQETLCHEIGHIYMESILINKKKQKSWCFEDRYIEDFVSNPTNKLIKFSKEYRLYKEAFQQKKLRSIADIIYTETGQPLTKYGLSAKDDTEMIADSMSYHLIRNKKIIIISALAASAARDEQKLRRAS